MMFADYFDCLITVCHALRNIEILRAGERRFKREHRISRPSDKAVPHFSDQYERRVFEMPDLQKLPDHRRFEYRADAARRDDKGVRSKHEMMQPRKKCPMLETRFDEWIDFL